VRSYAIVTNRGSENVAGTLLVPAMNTSVPAGLTATSVACAIPPFGANRRFHTAGLANTARAGMAEMNTIVSAATTRTKRIGTSPPGSICSHRSFAPMRLPDQSRSDTPLRRPRHTRARPAMR
jgi:hypothetical protein